MPSQDTATEVIEHERRLVGHLAGLSNNDGVVFNNDGWDSRVYIINNGQFVFKFPRSDKIKSRYRCETAVLELAVELARDIKIPKVIWTHPANDYFGYEGVLGTPLRQKAANLDVSTRQTIGKSLGEFLQRFHNLALPEARDMSLTEEVAQIQNWYQKNTPLFHTLFTDSDHQKLHQLLYDTWPQELANLGVNTVLCHGDFHFQNIFYTNDGQLGIIDFGDVCRADCSRDFADFDDEVIFETALQAYGDSPIMRQKIAIRSAMFQIISVIFFAVKKDDQGVHETVAKIQAFLA